MSRSITKNSRRRQRRRSRRLVQHASPPIIPSIADDQVLSIRDWAKLNGIGVRTAWRIIKSGTGPTIIELSENRIGITIRNNRAWQQSRERA